MKDDDIAPETTADFPEIDTETPSAARIYDYYLGGNHNWAVDREFGKRAVERFPLIKHLARANRDWLGRVVREAMNHGINQFLDLGSGVPTAGNVHEVARAHPRAGDDTRVVYVDKEPVAASHSQLILERQGALDWCGSVRADLSEADEVLRSKTVQRLIDWDQPVCLLTVAVLHFVGGSLPRQILSRYRERLPEGSWLAISHIANDAAKDDIQAAQVQDLVDSYRKTQNPGYLRDRAEITSWFDPLTLVEPGVVALPDWRPVPEHVRFPDLNADQVRPFAWCGVGEKPKSY